MDGLGRGEGVAVLGDSPDVRFTDVPNFSLPPDDPTASAYPSNTDSMLHCWKEGLTSINQGMSECVWGAGSPGDDPAPPTVSLSLSSTQADRQKP